jgi:hypothetical protein
MPGESLILINPRRRKRRRNPKSRRRMPAALRRYWASKRGTRLANPRRRRRRRNPVVHGYRRRKPIRARRRYANPRRKYRMRSHRRLRNPRGDLLGTLGAAAIGAGGAIGLAYAYGAVSAYLPASLQTGLAQSAVLGAGALAIGYLAGKFISQDVGQDVAFGGLTIVMFNAASSLAAGAGVTIPTALAGYADYTPRRLGAYMTGRPNTQGFRAHGAGGMAGLGYVSPAPVLRRPGMGAYMRNAPMNVAPSLGWSGDGM